MRAILARAVRKQFANELKETCPQFIKSCNPPKGCIVFDWMPKSSQHCFLILYPCQKRECFYVEAAISKSDQFPISLLPGLPTDAFSEKGELRFRITRLLAPEKNIDGWWVGQQSKVSDFLTELPRPLESDEQLLERVSAVVRECVLAIDQFVVPFFMARQ